MAVCRYRDRDGIDLSNQLLVIGDWLTAILLRDGLGPVRIDVADRNELRGIEFRIDAGMYGSQMPYADNGYFNRFHSLRGVV